jgi:hypothetical protein
MVAILPEKPQGSLITTVPGWRKHREKVFTHQVFESTLTTYNIMFQSSSASAGPEFLVFTGYLMIFMPPAMLMPAPKIGRSSPWRHESLPADTGQPSRHNRQIQRDVKLRKQSH